MVLMVPVINVIIFSTNFSFLSKNPYNCDCSIVWFLSKAPLRKKYILDLDQMKCAYPEKISGKKIVDLKEREICNAGIVLKRLFI